MIHSCDLETGICGVLPASDTDARGQVQSAVATVLYMTDPICSHCWALEPAWRKLRYYYGSQFSYRYVYGGLLPGWEGMSDPGAGIFGSADVAPHWREVAEMTGQPINPEVWLTDPLSSSFPPSRAALAVRLLDPTRESAFLRRMREQLFLQARNINHADVVAEAAMDIGLDRDRLLKQWLAGETEQLFVSNRAEMQRLGLRGFPSLLFSGPDGSRVVHGSRSYQELEQALLTVSGLEPVQVSGLTAVEALRAYGGGTLREFSELMAVDQHSTQSQLEAAGATDHAFTVPLLWGMSSQV